VSILEFLEDLEEKAEVDELINWWNWYDHHHYYVFVVQLMFFVAKYFLAMSSVPKVSPNKAHWRN
jgi:hypothetical protein